MNLKARIAALERRLTPVVRTGPGLRIVLGDELPPDAPGECTVVVRGQCAKGAIRPVAPHKWVIVNLPGPSSD